MLPRTFAFLLDTLFLLYWLTVRDFDWETLLLCPCCTVVPGHSQTLSLLHSLAGLELNLPGGRRTVSGGNIQAVLLRLTRTAVLTCHRLTNLPGDGVTPLAGHTLALLPSYDLWDYQALLGGNRLTFVAGFSLGRSLKLYKEEPVDEASNHTLL